ncbi:MAG: formimidoylglutamase [Flavobacteriia bacterium]|nr:formimidoylglutamase [Flavobacteriia bacterium]
MKDISIYFQPVDIDIAFSEDSLGSICGIHSKKGFPDMKKGGVALLYVPEYRNGNEKHQGKVNDAFRNYLYPLFPGENWNFPIYDCGTIIPGDRIEDTYYAVENVISELVKNQILPIVIGGSQDLTFALYKGYSQLEQMVNICSVDHKLDLGDPEGVLNSDGYLSHLMLERPCYLFNHANIGCQAPFVNKEEFILFDKLYFDICRLGEFNADFKKAEPHLRNADILSLDLQAIRTSDLRGKHYDSPNGFYADQICQISKYAGISDKLTSFGIFNYFPEQIDNAAYHLIAQIMWYFMDGIAMRKGDFPIGSKKDYIKFLVHLDDFKEEIVFYKSNKSERWWMEVPYPPQEKSKFERHHLVPCDFMDYELAMKNEIPNLWWKTYQKLG